MSKAEQIADLNAASGADEVAREQFIPCAHSRIRWMPDGVVRIEILRFLAKGKSLTALEALNRFNCLSLSQRVGELVKEGWPIKSKLVKKGSKHVAEYTYHHPKRVRV